MSFPPLLRHDLVHDSRIETRFFPRYTEHVLYEPGYSARQRRVRRCEKWFRQRRLGQGAFGVVYLEHSYDHSGKRLRAVKKIGKTSHSDRELNYARELQAIAKFSHKKYAHCFVKSEGWFESKNFVFIVMEYLPRGDLETYLTRPIPEFETREIVRQILEGLAFMHENEFAHRDLKPSNIMIVETGPQWFVKIADFGFSKRRQQDMTSHTRLIGTWGYMAPEVLGFIKDNPSESLTFAADMWSLGAVTYQLLSCARVFDDFGDISTYVECLRPIPIEPLNARNISGKGLEFVTDLLKVLPQERPKAATAIDHDWMKTVAAVHDREINGMSGIDRTSSEALDTGLPWSFSTCSVASKQWSTDMTDSLAKGATNISVSPAMIKGEEQGELSTETHAINGRGVRDRWYCIPPLPVSFSVKLQVDFSSPAHEEASHLCSEYCTSLAVVSSNPVCLASRKKPMNHHRVVTETPGRTMPTRSNSHHLVGEATSTLCGYSVVDTVDTFYTPANEEANVSFRYGEDRPVFSLLIPGVNRDLACSSSKFLKINMPRPPEYPRPYMGYSLMPYQFQPSPRPHEATGNLGPIWIRSTRPHEDTSNLEPIWIRSTAIISEHNSW